MKHYEMDNKTKVAADRIGLARGQDLYDDEYDFDEMNPEIAKMFGEADRWVNWEEWCNLEQQNGSRREVFMEDHAILSERLEDQLKAVEWAKAEQKRI